MSCSRAQSGPPDESEAESQHGLAEMMGRVLSSSWREWQMGVGREGRKREREGVKEESTMDGAHSAFA